jgi:hypothetical protein
MDRSDGRFAGFLALSRRPREIGLASVAGAIARAPTDGLVGRLGRGVWRHAAAGFPNFTPAPHWSLGLSERHETISADRTEFLGAINSDAGSIPAAATITGCSDPGQNETIVGYGEPQVRPAAGRASSAMRRMASGSVRFPKNLRFARTRNGFTRRPVIPSTASERMVQVAQAPLTPPGR